ncbi:orotate phosphoribosyltransferase [Desulfurispirillum indicum]|uniref:Orotate phosphoribosyltransferase n=1 Tax=Desulfurispirillum indicum (strain ATCC BAA-1389 / DSM 22839 / S5) TaxID=653733 RepID=E6W793_DESIS|nr:orotate phosphoribosyltransferase [Desulfurispirillum indicum]ADU66260.1 orotate phosphoribosyltransferase [Desulfurispirillum indicum S5]UCZ55591.1 orotate phosphoribosyltransferase [Desulfurispirillum indicum]
MMSNEQVLDVFRETGALLKGHFLLTSGKHSDSYLQCARVMQYPKKGELLCSELASKIEDAIDVVLAPALGGIRAGHEVARALGARSIYAEREHGKFTLRRGFVLQPGERVLIVEDVITTGGSVKEVIKLAQAHGAEVVRAASLVDRSNGTAQLGVPYTSLLVMSVPAYAPEECPMCREGKIDLVKPGSRDLIKQV